MKNRQWRLANRPAGWPSREDFEWAEEPAPDPAEGQLLVRTLYLSVDPYMRPRMRAQRGYTDPVGIGEVMVGGAVAEVVASRHRSFDVGDVVEAMAGWQDYAVVDGGQARPIDPDLAPISTALGVLGMPGLTAYFGLLEVGGAPSEGQTVFVSGAAGAVGSVVGQIARIRGCHVIGSAGSDEKVAWLTDELGFDAAFNYKRVRRTDNPMADYAAALNEHCTDGIDVYFDNVGGPLTDAVFTKLNVRGRVVVCGQISQYNNERLEMGPRLLGTLIAKRARVEGFLIFDYLHRYAEGIDALAGWLTSGQLRYRETVTEGLENAPEAFIGMMKGANIGKQLVHVATPGSPTNESG